jgi:hypothetical protein
MALRRITAERDTEPYHGSRVATLNNILFVLVAAFVYRIGKTVPLHIAARFFPQLRDYVRHR